MHKYIKSIKIHNPTGNNVEGLKFEFYSPYPIQRMGDGSYHLTCKDYEISISSTCLFYDGNNYPTINSNGEIANSIHTVNPPSIEAYFSFIEFYKNTDNTTGFGNIFDIILNNGLDHPNWRIIFGDIYDTDTYTNDDITYDISFKPLLTGSALFYNGNSNIDHTRPFYVDIDVSNMSISDMTKIPDGTELHWDYLPEAKEEYGHNDDLVISEIVPHNSAVGVSPDSPIQIHFNYNIPGLTIPDEFNIYVSKCSDTTDGWIEFKCKNDITCYYDSGFKLEIWLTAACRKWSYKYGIEGTTDSEYFNQYHDYYLAYMLDSDSQYYIKIPAGIFTNSISSNKEAIITFKTSNYPVLTSKDWYDGPGTVGAHTGGTGFTGDISNNAPDPGYTKIYTTGGTGGTGHCSETGGEPGLPGYYSGGTGGTGGICGSDTPPSSEDTTPTTPEDTDPPQQISFDVTSSTAISINNKRLTIDLSSTPLKPNTKYVLHVDDGAILSMSDDIIKVADIHFTTGSR